MTIKKNALVSHSKLKDTIFDVGCRLDCPLTVYTVFINHFCPGTGQTRVASLVPDPCYQKIPLFDGSDALDTHRPPRLATEPSCFLTNAGVTHSQNSRPDS
ncbi:hypothetical protein SK128_006395 [Halocaridina rubra]|uniref:Uncharacterized protein n=1 Tax=Halocaridina rubra TaxID=373956 RepID=A0AAN8WUV3_HALRR